MRPARWRSARAGLAALFKSLLLLVGVPVALARLWLAAPLPAGSPVAIAVGVALRVVLALVALVWLAAARSLAAELRDALRGRAPSASSWSSRWAAALVGLLLVLGAGAVVGQRAPARAPSAATAAAPASAGKPPTRLEDLAAALHGDGGSWVALARANRDRLLDHGGRFVDPSLLRPGWHLAPGAAPIAPASRGDRHELEELALLGLGILTTAALARRVRTLQQAARASRRAGEGLERAPSELEELDAAIAPFADATLLDWIDVANRLLGAVCRERSRNVEPRLVRAGPDGVAFLLAEALEDAFPPFVASGGGRWWTLPVDEPLAVHLRHATAAPRAAPWLLPLGDDGVDAWLVAVGPGHHLVLAGEPNARTATMRGLVTALRTLPWAEELQVELIGIAPPPSDERCYQLVSSSAAELRDLATWPLRDRHAPGEPAWRREPIVLLDDELDLDLLAEVNAVSGVVSTTGVGDLRLVIEDDRCRLEPFDVKLAVPRPSVAACDLVERLLDRAALQPRVVPLSPPTASEGPGLDLGLEIGDRPRARVTAGLAPRDQARAAELLAYLALHDHVASEAAVLGALFPGRKEASRTRLSELALALRSALGADAGGIALLAIGRDGSLRLRGRLETDWSRFRDACAMARAAGPAEALAAWRRALGIAPALPTDAPAWLVAEGHVAALVFELCDARHQLAALALAAGELAEAETVVRTGLVAEPTSELLLRDLLILTDLSGGANALGERYLEVETVLAQAAGIEPSEETRRLFDALSAKQR